jgi:hypothetical protein
MKLLMFTFLLSWPSCGQTLMPILAGGTPPSSSTPIALVQQVSNDALALTVSASFNTPPAIGNTVIVACFTNGNPQSVSDNQSGGNVYTTNLTQNSFDGYTISSMVVGASTGTFTVTCTNNSYNGTKAAISISEWSGLVTSNVFDVAGYESGQYPSNPYSISTSPSTSQAKELVIGIVWHHLDGTFYSIGSGFTLVNNRNLGGATNWSFMVEYKTVSSVGVQTAGFTSTQNGWLFSLICATYRGN